MPTISGYTFQSALNLTCGTLSTNAQVTGTAGGVLVITNYGMNAAFCATGSASSVTATPASAAVVAPWPAPPLVFNVAAGTLFIAGVTLQGSTAINVVLGT